MDFYSKRLFLRALQEDDYPLFSSVFSNEEVMKYAYMDQITEQNDMDRYFRSIMDSDEVNQTRDVYILPAFLRENGDFIGFGEIIVNYHLSKVKFGEIGYFLLPRYWGSGYATEIAEVLTEKCFRELKMHKVVATCNANNASSENIMKKIGMVKEGQLRKERFKNGNWDDELRYSILIEEWESRT